jgi:hypothetical protein
MKERERERERGKRKIIISYQKKKLLKQSHLQ